MARRGGIALAALPLLALLVVVMGAGVAGEGAGERGGVELGAVAVADIPPGYLALYIQAAGASGLDWAVLAAIGKIESDHGRSSVPGVRSGFNLHGCCAGPMQFYANRTLTGGRDTTWDRYRLDGNGDGVRDVYDPADAIPAAGSYLRAAGAPADYPRAIFAYNHSSEYVERVLSLAGDYRKAAVATGPAGRAAQRSGRLAPVPAAIATRPGIPIDEAFLPLAQGIASQFGLRVLSGYRSPAHNQGVGGAARSDHLCGVAADFIGSMEAMLAAQDWVSAQGFAFVDGPATNLDGNHGDHVHVSFARCG